MKKTMIFLSISLSFVFVSISKAVEVNLNSTNSNTNVNTTVSSGAYSVAIFTNSLSVGSYGKDVMALKKIISLEFNTTLDPSATFTSDTANDVKKLQEKYATEILIPNGLSSGTGFVGASTKTKLNQLAAKYSITLSDFTLPTANTIRSVFATTLQLGSSGDDVSLLKIVLNSDNDTRIAASASGVTNIFDLATQAAVNKFQEKYASEILTPSGLTSGTGTVGPATRKKLNYILNNILYSTQTPNATTTSNKSLLVALSSNSSSNQINNSNNTTVSPTPVILPIAGKSDSFAPVITLIANPTQVLAGQSTTFNWNATNATGTCNITATDSSGNILHSTINSSGIQSSGPIKQTTTYTIICYNKYGIPGSQNVLVKIISTTTQVAATQQNYPQAATITSIIPVSGNRGDTVVIKGINFLSTNNILFDGIKIDNSLILSVSSTSISFKIPQFNSCLSASCLPPAVDTSVETGGKKTIQVSNANGFSNNVSFTLPSNIITIPKATTVKPYSLQLTVSSITPTSGNRGDTATIYGGGFSFDSLVLFGGFEVANNLILSRNNNSISFIVPPFQLGCTDPTYEICPRLPIAGSGTIIETGGVKDVYVMNMSNKATSTTLQFTLPGKKITY